jgi:hypothetical protein
MGNRSHSQYFMKQWRDGFRQFNRFRKQLRFQPRHFTICRRGVFGDRRLRQEFHHSGWRNLQIRVRQTWTSSDG